MPTATTTKPHNKTNKQNKNQIKSNHATVNSGARSCDSVIWKKNEGNENKIILGDFNCTIDKNSLWIMGLRINGEGRTLISLISLGTIGPLPRIQDRRHLY